MRDAQAIEAGEDLAQHRLDLRAPQVSAEAEVWAASAEGDVLVGPPPDVEHARRGEGVGIAVGSGVTRIRAMKTVPSSTSVPVPT